MLFRACLPLWLMICLMLPLSLKWGKQIVWSHQVKLVCIKHAGSSLYTTLSVLTICLYIERYWKQTTCPLQQKESCWSPWRSLWGFTGFEECKWVCVIRAHVCWRLGRVADSPRWSKMPNSEAAGFIRVALLQWCSAVLRVINGADVSVSNRNLRHERCRKPCVRRRELLNNNLPMLVMETRTWSRTVVDWMNHCKSKVRLVGVRLSRSIQIWCTFDNSEIVSECFWTVRYEHCEQCFSDLTTPCRTSCKWIRAMQDLPREGRTDRERIRDISCLFLK